jgi:hypothetical protein
MTLPVPRRTRAARRLQHLLLSRSHPRLQMTLLLSATGLAGFLASKLLHALGLNAMWLRYPLAVGAAYLVFFLLLSLWIASFRMRGWLSESGGDHDLDLDFVDGDDVPPPPSPVVSSSSSDPGPGAVSISGSGGGGGGGGGFSFDAGDSEGGFFLVVVVLILLALCTAFFASLYVIIEAPVLLAEALVDGVLMVSLARRLRSRGSQHWAAGVRRRTIVPVLLVALCFAVVGWALEYYVPGATTMGEAFHGAKR